MSKTEAFTENTIVIERKRCGWVVSTRPPEGGVILSMKKHASEEQALSFIGQNYNVAGL
jgi:hypothetical protein